MARLDEPMKSLQPVFVKLSHMDEVRPAARARRPRHLYKPARGRVSVLCSSNQTSARVLIAVSTALDSCICSSRVLVYFMCVRVLRRR
jgi:hypothetical protein